MNENKNDQLFKVLDVGCGSGKVNGSIGVDHLPLTGVDVVHDLNQYPWPFSDFEFDRIVFSHSISHLQNISKVLIECHRLLKKGGYIEIVAPHYTSDNFNTDPTHCVHLGARSMNYFTKCDNFGYSYISPENEYILKHVYLSFREAPATWRKKLKFNPYKTIGLEWLVNRFPRIYERFFCWIIPCSEVYFVLHKEEL